MKQSIAALCVLLSFCLLSFNVSAEEGSMKISSPAFAENGKIPKSCTCDGENASPSPDSRRCARRDQVSRADRR